jgi:NitT/TauT family transport system permease protein
MYMSDMDKNISPEHKLFLLKVKRQKIAVNTARIAILVALIILWEVLAQFRMIDSFITSSPSRIVRTLVNLYREGTLFRHILVTCSETVIGFLLGTLLGTLIAVILWSSSFLARVFEPYLVVLNSLPKVALGPIFIVWAGAGPVSIIMMALAISLIVTIMEVLNGFLGVDRDKIKLMEAFGANRFQTFAKVVLPSTRPVIMNALKINVGLSWVGVIMGEFLVSKAGIGYLIVYGGQVFKLDLVMASVIILGIAATLMYHGVLFLERILFRNS